MFLQDLGLQLSKPNPSHISQRLGFIGVWGLGFRVASIAQRQSPLEHCLAQANVFPAKRITVGCALIRHSGGA